MRQKLRAIVGPIIVVITISLFVYYIVKNPTVIDRISQLHPLLVAALLVLYCGTNVALVLVLASQLRLLRTRMTIRDNFSLNVYSSLMNFFGPGQSGVGFRGIFLKKKYGISLKDFFYVTLLYYACFGVINVFFVGIGSLPWWLTLPGTLGAVCGSYLIIRSRTRKRATTTHFLPLLGLLIGATALQMILQAVIYGIELHAVGASASIAQVVSYTGIANLATFAALTPGAIGIREAFLVFSESLHGISRDSIIAASVIDRSVYLLFMGILFLATISLHAKDRITSVTKSTK